MEQLNGAPRRPGANSDLVARVVDPNQRIPGQPLVASRRPGGGGLSRPVARHARHQRQRDGPTPRAPAPPASTDQLARQVDDQRVARLQRQVSRMAPAAGLTPVSGPGLSVTLNDAPPNQQVPPAIGPNALVVHQQDIQAVVNALWAGG